MRAFFVETLWAVPMMTLQMEARIAPKFTPNQFRFLYESFSLLMENVPPHILRMISARPESAVVLANLEASYERVGGDLTKREERPRPPELKGFRNRHAAQEDGYVSLTQPINIRDESTIDSLRITLAGVDAAECPVTGHEHGVNCIEFFRHESEYIYREYDY